MNKFYDHYVLPYTTIKSDSHVEYLKTQLCRISTERVVGRSKEVRKRWLRNIWVVRETCTYEMAGDHRGPLMGGICFAETEYTGAEWLFRNEKDAEKFAYNS